MNNYFKLNLVASTAWVIKNLLERAYVRITNTESGKLRVVARTWASRRTIIAETVFALQTPIAPLERWQIEGSDAKTFKEAESITEKMKEILDDITYPFNVWLFQPNGETRGEFRGELLKTPVNGFTVGEFLPVQEFSLDLAAAILGFDTQKELENWLDAGSHACFRDHLMALISKRLGPNARLNNWGHLSLDFASEDL